jgi:hypothetical protein
LSVKTQLIAFNAGLAAACALLFAPPFLGIPINLDSYAGAFGCTLAVVMLGAFAAVNVRILMPRRIHIPPAEGGGPLAESIFRINDYIIKNADIFRRHLLTMAEQASRFRKKKEAAAKMAGEKLGESMAAGYAGGTTEKLEKLMTANINGITASLWAFDEEEYAPAAASCAESAKAEIFREYQKRVDDAVNLNEEILLAIDRMILEMGKVDALDKEAAAKISAHTMILIDGLVKNAKIEL